MCGALLAGMVGEFELRYAFIMAAGMALSAGLVCVFLNFTITAASRDEPLIATVANPADP
jgi:ribose/xylose/arabinose/galactoside ABC-type transport system permease subunit